MLIFFCKENWFSKKNTDILLKICYNKRDWWNNIKITIFKELRGIVRDKKSLQKLIIYPLLIPLVLLLFGVLFDSVNESKYTVGINYPLTEEEKGIIKEFENLSVKTYSTKEELKDAYVHNKIDGYVVKKENIYEIYYDESQNSGEVVYSLTSSYLDSYSKILGTQELLKNNVDPNKVFHNIVIEEKSLVKNDSNVISTVIFSLVITYLIMIVVMVCVVVVTDAISFSSTKSLFIELNDLLKFYLFWLVFKSPTIPTAGESRL